jgi:hypothetical protein
MSAPVSNGIIVGAYLPLIKRLNDTRKCRYSFEDVYAKEYKRLGVRRDEMMVLMPHVQRVDILTGNQRLNYVGEEVSEEK